MFKSMLCRVESFLRRTITNIVCGARIAMLAYGYTIASVFFLAVAVCYPHMIMFLAILWILITILEVIYQSAGRR